MNFLLLFFRLFALIIDSVVGFDFTESCSTSQTSDSEDDVIRSRMTGLRGKRDLIFYKCS